MFENTNLKHFSKIRKKLTLLGQFFKSVKLKLLKYKL